MEEYGLRGKKLILALIVAGAVAILFRNSLDRKSVV